MRFVVGVLTHNVLSGLRSELLEATLQSIEVAFPRARLVLLDNGSSDGSADMLSEQGRTRWQFVKHVPEDGNSTPGPGRNAMLATVMQLPRVHRDDIVVFSDDDMLWREGAEARLQALWLHVPDDVVIVSGLLEPAYDWNTPRETVACGAEKILVRDSCPAAAWTFRRDWMERYRGASYDVFTHGFGEDHDFCLQLAEDGLRVAQIDLAEHMGWGYSTHGNDADEHLDARPLDREKWGV